MISVFLVDDEIVVREGIRNSIPWDETEYSLVGEAPDGEMALSIMKDLKPDILVTDIRMPFMDGLSLAKIIRKTQPWVKIIILSGHDEFKYAKEAISIGVEEYLLKPVSSADMLATLDKVSRKIAEERLSKTRLEALSRQVRTSEEILRERWLCDLVAGLVATEEAIERGREVGIDLIAHGYIVALAEIASAPGKYSGVATARTVIADQISGRGDVIAFSRGMDTIALLVKNNGQDSLEECVYTIAQGIKFEIERITGSEVSIGIGSPADRIGGIPRSFADADLALKHLSQSGRRNILGIGDLRPGEEIDISALDGDPIIDRLRYASSGDIDGIIEEYLGLLGDKPGQGNFIWYYLIGDIIVAASKLVEELGGDIHDVMPEFLQHERITGIVTSRESFGREVRALLLAVVTFKESRMPSRYRVMIDRAKQYIEANFADQDISLHSVASHVNVSPNHFSAVFSQEAGVSFIEYLTRTRIDHAKHLLSTTGMKNSDVAYESGFGDPHYFSFIFKKNTGLTPREFKSGK